MKSVNLKNVKITGGYWKARTDINRNITLPTEYEQLKETGRLYTFRQEWTEGNPNKPHFFWDSDIAKWIEAAAYSLTHHPDINLEKQIDNVIDEIESAQWEDGYLNSYYTVVEKENRWKNICIKHELYCAGHLIEAAVEYYKATGKKKFLDIMCKYVDHINSVFGPEKGKLHGYPGHEEIELALIKLYKITNDEKHLKLSEYFVTERGKQPLYFDLELKINPNIQRFKRQKGTKKPYAEFQAHKPVIEQKTIEGHSVRALYFLAGVADVAEQTSNSKLLKACETLYNNMVNKRMYITGGIGSTPDVERFSFDYDLPNETGYAETCAAIASVFFCNRMLNITYDGKYADTMEQTLYNGVMAGISLDGTEFFYSNPLAVNTEAIDEETLEFKSHMGYKRRKWFGCACCPPNIARLLSSLGLYFYSYDFNGVYVNLYGDSIFSHDELTLEQKTNYPWDEIVNITVGCDVECKKTIALRIPGWCRKLRITVNGIDITPEFKKGYAYINRVWHNEDEIELTLEMTVEKMQAHPSVRHDAGKIALKRGPIVYCIEKEDNGKDLTAIAIRPHDKFISTFESNFLGGCTYLTGPAYRLSKEEFGDVLYRPYSPDYEKIEIKAIPYAMWANRTPGDMTVWINTL
ncbi:MAG: glycoside hydrolase family 127 protein [Clostridiales bacterium]|nr:glycoside hydrolase family 127 protein [Clostridiales bacterium]